MSEHEAMNLIHMPGLSTAQKVTDVSGRGVGMDVVKTNLDKLGGVVDIESNLGKKRPPYRLLIYEHQTRVNM